MNFSKLYSSHCVNVLAGIFEILFSPFIQQTINLQTYQAVTRLETKKFKFIWMCHHMPKQNISFLARFHLNSFSPVFCDCLQYANIKINQSKLYFLNFLRSLEWSNIDLMATFSSIILVAIIRVICWNYDLVVKREDTRQSKCLDAPQMLTKGKNPYHVF